MGMSSSQARLLSLTSRQHDIEYKAQRLQAQKLQLSGNSDAAYTNYLNALNSKKVQAQVLDATNGCDTFKDATLAMLENGSIPGYTGDATAKTFLIHNLDTNDIFITPEFANAHGLSATDKYVAPDEETYLAEHGCTKEEIKKTEYQTDYSTILSATPVENQVLTNPTTYTIPDPDTYSISGSLSTPVDNTIGATTNYSVSGTTPSVTNVDPVSTPKTKTVVTSGVDATSQAESITTSTTSALTKSDYLIPSNQKYKVINSNSYAIDTTDLNLTMQQLSDKYGWNWSFTDTTQGSTALNTLTTSYGVSEVNSVYGVGASNFKKLTYTSTTTLNELINHITSISGAGITYSNGVLTGPRKFFRFSSDDDATGTTTTNQLSDYLNKTKTVNYGTEQTFTSDTLMKDLICSNISKGNYGDFTIYEPSGGTQYTKPDGTIVDNCTYRYNLGTVPTNFTYKQYLNYIQADPEMSAAGFTWSEDSEGIHSSIGNGYTIKMLSYIQGIAGTLSNETTNTNNTTITLNKDAIAEDIYLARSIVNGTKDSDYSANHDSSITNILNELNTAYNSYSTDENKRQLALFNDALSTAIKSGDKTKISQALALIGTTISSTNYVSGTTSSSKSSTSGYITTINTTKNVNNISYAWDTTDVSITPSTQNVSDGAIVTPGTLTTASNSDMQKYLAYQLWQTSSSKTYETYLSSIQNNSYDAYQLSQLVQEFNTYKSQLAAGTDLKSSLTKYTSSTYNLNQASSNNYNVTNTSTAPVYNVTVANPDDILDRLAYDIYTKQGSTGNPNTIKSSLSGILNNKQLASLSSYYGSSTWNTIVNNLASNMNASSVSAYTTKYDAYNVTYKSSNDETINTISNSHTGKTKGTMNIPTIEGIASNLVVALRKAGYTVNEADVLAKLKAKYDTATPANNENLASINDYIAKYITSGADSSYMSSLYNHIYNGGSLSLPATSQYSSSDYDFTRKELGACNVQYKINAVEVGTGEFKWKDDDAYKKAESDWKGLKAMEGYGIVIVDESLTKSNKFISNLLSSLNYVLVNFNNETNEMGSDTSVATETSLREVDDDSNVKKAEATYEADLRKINTKETKIDTELSKLETERKSITEEEETLKQVIKNNVDLSFKLFS